MRENNLSVYVITRLGIGQNSSSFYDQELPYLENLLIKSIIKQKKYITKWLILIDVNTPKYVSEKLKKLIPHDILYICPLDPLLAGSIMPNISMILKDMGVKDNDKIITIRVDADDMLSNNYVSSVIETIRTDNLLNTFNEISVNAINGIFFYPIRKKLVRVVKKNYSVQALYSVFGKDFHSVHDYPHGKIGKEVLNKGGHYCELDNQDFWIRSIRQHSVTRFGKKLKLFDARFDLIKNFIKKILYKFLKNNTFYKERVDSTDLLDNFQFSDELILFFQNHENNLKKNKITFSPMTKDIINNKKGFNQFDVKDILLKMYKKETNKEKKAKIKEEFYNL